MNTRNIKLTAFAAAFATVLLLSLTSSGGDDDPAISSPFKALGFPRVEWIKTFPGKLTGFSVAPENGAVAAAIDDRVYYMSDGPDADWTAGGGEKWKYVGDVDISRDGSKVLFQTDTKKKVHTEQMDYTIHYYDGQGNELWAKKNPYRYQNIMLSPRGNYIIIGELLHPGIKVMDGNLNQLYSHDIQFWYLVIDPNERFLFDGEGGILYTMKGEQVWDFGRFTRVLSISDDAQCVMTSYYRTKKTGNQMFLNHRAALKKIEMTGSGGCVSPDGSLTAYVNDDDKLVVYRTMELISSGPEDLPPLFETRFKRPWAISIARDNRSLFVLGEQSMNISTMMLVDLEKMKKAWEQPVDDQIRHAQTTDDNRIAVVQTGAKQLTRYKLY